MRLLFSFLAGLALSPLHAQPTKKAAATVSMPLTRTATMEQTEARCIEQARLKAVGDAFGYTVSETTLQRIADTRNTFEDHFSLLTRTSVEGEWIEDLEPPALQWACNGEELIVTTTVHGRIRAFGDRAKAQVSFLASTPGEAAGRDQFMHGQTLHALFRSSHSGHLSVFFIDHATGTAYRVFPATAYAAQDHLPVEADRSYQLFDRAHAKQFPAHPAVTELTVEVPAGKPQAIDELVAVYAPAPYAKPLLSQAASPEDLPGMGVEDFEAWLTALRKRDPQAVVKRAQVMVVR